MSEFDDAHAFVNGFFAALAARAPQSASLKSSHDVVESCLRLENLSIRSRIRIERQTSHSPQLALWRL